MDAVFRHHRAPAGRRVALARGGAAALPPSLIFAGPEGVGKRLTATALAQALNCARATTRDACGTCPACTRIARGVHADILLVEPGDSGAIKVDQVREAIDSAAYRPFEGRRRVVIVDEADALMPEAQNALLKTLEEPPPASVFVLITSAARRAAADGTIALSAAALRPARIAQDVAAVLMRDHGVARRGRARGGRRGRTAVSGARSPKAARGRDRGARRGGAAAAGAAASSDPRRRLDGAKALAGGSGDRDELSRRLLAMSSLTARSRPARRRRAATSALANADLRPQLQALLRTFDASRASRAFGVVDRALDALDRNASPKIVADWVALHL